MAKNKNKHVFEDGEEATLFDLFDDFKTKEPEKPKELTEDDYLPYNAATGQYRAGYKPKK